MAAAQGPKGNKVKLSMFNSWGKGSVLGYKTEESNSISYVNFIWCKVCARNSNSLLNHHKCKGEVKNSIKTFINGTNGVTKHAVDRHLKGKMHELALSIEREKPASKRMIISQEGASSHQHQEISQQSPPVSRDLHTTPTRNCFVPRMSSSQFWFFFYKHFSVLVRCQKQNGVSLIQGKQDGKAAREFICSIGEAITEKVAVVLAGSDFMSILSDGSQARKTRSEKELVLTRVERGGLPCYFNVTSLVEMADHGGTNAESIKKGIDHVFKKEMGLLEHVYEKHVVSATSDGASVNTGIYKGVLTQLKAERPWLTTIHCVNHRIELALKDATNVPFLRNAELLYLTIYNLLRRSGALKEEVKEAAEVLGNTYYVLTRIHGIHITLFMPILLTPRQRFWDC